MSTGLDQFSFSGEPFNINIGDGDKASHNVILPILLKAQDQTRPHPHYSSQRDTEAAFN